MQAIDIRPPIPLPVQPPSEPTAFVTQQLRWKPLELGDMDILCGFCGAHHGLAEHVLSSSNLRPIFESSCKKGDVTLPRLQQCLQPLQSLFVGDTAGSRLFRTKICEYNAALSFTSIKYTRDQRTVNWGNGVQCFQIHGELYHLQGPLEPAEDQHPQFAQLFLFDLAFAADSRSIQHPTLDPVILQQLTDMLHQCNPYIEIYQTAKERLEDIPPELGNMQVILNPRLQLIMEAGADKRRYNLPTSNEVAMIIGDEYCEAGFRDIVLASRNSSGRLHLTTINPNHGSYMPLHYVLLFPNGELGWHWALQLLDQAGNQKNTRLAQRAFYCYPLHPRSGESNHIFCSQRLWQQYLVDEWAVCDQNKLEWLQNNQSNLRDDLYNGLADALLRNEEDASAIGQRTRSSFLPAFQVEIDSCNNYFKIVWRLFDISDDPLFSLRLQQIQSGRKLRRHFCLDRQLLIARIWLQGYFI